MRPHKRQRKAPVVTIIEMQPEIKHLPILGIDTNIPTGNQILFVQISEYVQRTKQGKPTNKLATKFIIVRALDLYEWHQVNIESVW